MLSALATNRPTMPATQRRMRTLSRRRTSRVRRPAPLTGAERLVVVRDGKRVSVQNQEIWQDFIRAAIPPGITQFFFFDGETIQAIAADDHSEVRLKSSLEAALGIQYINRLSDFLFVASRSVNNNGAGDVLWVPGQNR